ncbi:MAG: hypothetical protein ACREPL_15325 [Rhodanobacteraceae bacterium]
MNKACGLVLVGMVTCSVAVAAWAATSNSTMRVRGTIESVGAHAVAIKAYKGSVSHLQLASTTKYVWVVPSSLDAIGKGDFIGAGASGPKDHLTALEVVIFPASMRGVGEGHYPWAIPATVAHADMHGAGSSAPAGAPPVEGTMTNGTVSSVGGAPAGAPPVKGTMTNATVTGSSSNAGGGRTLTVSYSGGQTVQITVLPDTPVVRFEPAQQSILAKGLKVFAIANASEAGRHPAAAFIAVGKNGLMPPM